MLSCVLYFSAGGGGSSYYGTLLNPETISGIQNGNGKVKITLLASSYLIPSIQIGLINPQLTSTLNRYLIAQHAIDGNFKTMAHSGNPSNPSDTFTVNFAKMANIQYVILYPRRTYSPGYGGCCWDRYQTMTLEVVQADGTSTTALPIGYSETYRTEAFYSKNI